MNELKITPIHPLTLPKELFSYVTVLSPFEAEILNFVDAFSKKLIEDFRAYPEMVSLGFWMRNTHIEQLQQRFEAYEGLHVARGTVLHFAPSNVDTIFIYSWFLSLLTGNRNIIRLSTRQSKQSAALIALLQELFENEAHKHIAKRTVILQYDHDETITAWLSAQCDTRVIWGGDKTITDIRAVPIPPTATELTFADKFSFAVINASAFLKLENTGAFIHDFYNDAFWFGQQACSSIRMIIWVGDKVTCKAASEYFIQLLSDYESQKPLELSAADVMNKQVALYALGSTGMGSVNTYNDQHIHTIKLSSLDTMYEEQHCGTGLLYEYYADSLEKIFLHINKKHQSLSYFGFEKEQFADMIRKYQPHGIDRIIPVGKSLEFSHVWDGYDLMRSFTREIKIT